MTTDLVFPGARRILRPVNIRFYDYKDAMTLLTDFWTEVRTDFEGKESGAMKTLKVGIASREAYKKRTLAIAKGEYIPAKDEPKFGLNRSGHCPRYFPIRIEIC